MTGEHSFTLDFHVADSLLLHAGEGTLAAHGNVSLQRGNRIGPLIELAMARAHTPKHYAAVRVADNRMTAIGNALDRAGISGDGYQATFGVFPLQRLGGAKEQQEVWDQWCMRFHLAAQSSGFPRNFADALTGAMGELQDNVLVHSEDPDSGVVAYMGAQGTFEFVVADRGVGVLQSLRRNPSYLTVRHAGEALQIAVSDGASRFADGTGHGYGISQLFRALAGYEGDIRFRSGDHAYSLSGSSPGPRGTSELAQKAHLPGLAVSIICRTRVPGSRSSR